MKELLGGDEDEEEEVSNKRAKKGSTKRKADEEEEEEDDFADLLGDHSDMDGSDVSSDEEEGAEDFLAPAAKTAVLTLRRSRSSARVP